MVTRCRQDIWTCLNITRLECAETKNKRYAEARQCFYLSFFCYTSRLKSARKVFRSTSGLDKKHLSEELFFQLVGPLLVGLGVHSQVTNVCTLQHHLHAHTLRQNDFSHHWWAVQITHVADRSAPCCSRFAIERSRHP